MVSAWKGFFLLRWDPRLSFTRLTPDYTLPTQPPHGVRVIPTAACVGGCGDPSCRDFGHKQRTASPLLDRPAAPCLRVLPLPRCLPPLGKGLGICKPSPSSPFFCRCSRAAGQQQSVVSPGTVRPRNTGFAVWRDQEAEVGRETEWMKAPTGHKNPCSKNWNWLQEIWKATENSLGVWYLSICSKLPQMESWVPQDEVKRWKQAIHETTTAGCGSLTGRKSIIQLWPDSDYDD